MRTYQQKPTEVQRRWWLVDAQGKVLGRVASQVAVLLRGKHKPTFTPHVDGGDFVVVVNADKVRLTGRKAERKVYYWHSGYPGGLRSATAGELLRTKPEELFRLAVQRMLPKTRLGRQMLRKLKVYRGPVHPHVAQQPQKLEVER
ncbi:MAG: 50S ribosomal protein L13 [Armatimonadota bacterium]|nr:50S ribosomal protein L13 [Armatimonadota bacterium]MDR7439230.1 50S ribosomal protein L13 [Armatimonadota bacterium]MDR7563307.1 50S ribosomal protein L13 [Armatimonadota bacterium]MDR7567381.1 50S ribosomal protein L13 [Armatimonadota bacterium]MDR7602378.1 50S ribosomal protein L13 [Armatimonadota bacterium]